MVDQVTFRWESGDAAGLDTVTMKLRAEGAQVERLEPERPGIAPLLIIAGAAGFAVIAKTIWAILKEGEDRDRRRFGVLIDGRTTPVTVQEVPSWDPCRVVILTATEPILHDTCESGASVNDLIKAVSKIGAGSSG